MNEQHFFLLALFLIVALIIAGLFLYVYWTARPGVDPQSQKGLGKALYKRIILAVILVAVLVILLSVTLQKIPYYDYAKVEPAKIAFVYAHQFDFIMSDHSIDPNKESASGPIVLPLGQVVEFRVTSLDVNHGFAVYNPHEQIIEQTQAMPGYVNRLRWKFDQPGTYEVRCLEYCGFGHAFMRASFTVK